jgi:hypothetical protein
MSWQYSLWHLARGLRDYTQSLRRKSGVMSPAAARFVIRVWMRRRWWVSISMN